MSRLVRQEKLKKAGFNVLLLEPHQVPHDYLTDSLKNHNFDMLECAMLPHSDLHETVSSLFGFPYSLALSQGRLGEALLANLLIERGTLVPSNLAFITTQCHQKLRGALTENVINSDAFSYQSSFAFKGDVDLDLLERLLKKHRGRWTAYVSIELSNNQVGGQPISIQNLKAIRKLTEEYSVKVFLDGCRILNQAYQIKERENGYQDLPVWDIVKQICALADGMNLSLTKNFPLSHGALVLFRDKALYERSFDFSLLMGDGLDEKAKKIINVVLNRKDENSTAVEKQMGLVKKASEALKNFGFRLLEPFGGHALYIDFSDLFSKADDKKNFFQSLFSEWYLEYGLRASHHRISGNDSIVRFAFPTLYGENEVTYLLDSLFDWDLKGQQIFPLKKVYVPQGFTGESRVLYLPLADHEKSGQSCVLVHN
jgi:tyrosine phenol-lyase